MSGQYSKVWCDVNVAFELQVSGTHTRTIFAYILSVQSEIYFFFVADRT